jgi:predicted RNA-binding protein associated with RNAse of E/G family
MKKEDLLADVDDVLDSGLITPMQVASFYKNQQIYKMLQAKAQEMNYQSRKGITVLWGQNW